MNVSPRSVGVTRICVLWSVRVRGIRLLLECLARILDRVYWVVVRGRMVDLHR